VGSGRRQLFSNPTVLEETIPSYNLESKVDYEGVVFLAYRIKGIIVVNI